GRRWLPPHVLPLCDQQASPTASLVCAWILRFVSSLDARVPKNSRRRSCQRTGTFADWHHSNHELRRRRRERRVLQEQVRRWRERRGRRAR
ncbi:unnamed protein product, partial [Ectocarpus sp. 13 AM-2016]